MDTANLNCSIKTHGSVLCGPRKRGAGKWITAQENGARANGVNILTGTTKLRFSCIRSSMMSNPNGTKFTVELASTHISNLNKIPQAVPEI